MTIIPIKEYYIRNEVEKDVSHQYIFTDNMNRTSGYNKILENNSSYYNMYCRDKVKYYPNTTMAVVRGLYNAYPITTMKDEKRTQFTDEDFNLFKANLNSEIHVIKCFSHLYKGLKYNNENQFGNANISKMKFSAPKCWEYLNEKLLEINIINN